MIKIALTTAAVLASSATGASAYAYNGQQQSRHACIGRHGHVARNSPRPF